jgi:hypothetical protein
VKAGPTTAYSQQWVEMRKKGIENPDPRNSILEDISTLIYEWGEKGFHPLVMLDANATQDKRQFSDFIERHDLKDIISEVNEGIPPPTYERGTTKIDYILGPDHIIQAVVKSGSMGTH